MFSYWDTQEVEDALWLVSTIEDFHDGVVFVLFDAGFRDFVDVGFIEGECPVFLTADEIGPLGFERLNRILASSYGQRILDDLFCDPFPDELTESQFAKAVWDLPEIPEDSGLYFYDTANNAASDLRDELNRR